MKRKYLSALLMGTLTVASMSTFTSCKDYDDDISNLQEQIDKLATADQLAQKVSELQALISSNQSGISSLETKLAEVKATADSKATLDEVKTILADYATNENVTAEANKIVNAAIKALQEKDIAELKAAIEAAKTEALKGVEEAKQANADVLKNLTENYSTTAETQTALNTAIEALKADNAKALKEAVDKIYKDLEAYAKQADLKPVADKVAEVEKALASKVDDKTLDTKVEELNKAIKDAKDENAGKIADLAKTVKTAGDNLTKVQQNLTNVETAVKTLGTGFDEKNTVAAAIEAIKTQLGTPDLKLGTLDERLAAIELALKGDDSDKLPGLKAQIEAIDKQLKDIIGEYTTMVTSVELVASYSAQQSGLGQNLPYQLNINLDMIHGLVAESSTFGDEVSDKIENPISYVKGQDVKDDNSIIVRINPVNAELTKNTKIVLLNSKGESLEDYVTVGKPSKFTDLITATRATSVNTGLWKLPVHVAKGVSKDDFKKAVTAENGKTILYAVAVKNTETQKDAQDRYVVSTYDVKPSYTDFVANKDFTFKVDGTSVSDIHNRWNGDRIWGENARDNSNENPELKWNSYGPATAPVYKTEGDVNKNVENSNNDARYWKSLLQVEVGKKFTISDVAALAGSTTTNAADYYYVVLDKKNAIESGVSEINAWNSYDIKGLNTTVKAGENLDLVINSKSANTDIIGFRVYAVNRDGKLLDPDGKAFYVIVGNAISGNIVGNYDAVNRVTDKKEFKFADGVYYTGWEIDEEASKDVLPFWDSETHSGSKPSIVPVYYKEDGKTTTTNTSEVAYVAFKIYNPQYIKNGGTLVLKNVVRSNSQYGASYEVGTVRAMYTKVLPQAFPSDITFRPKQETVDGSGNFKAYMKPVSDYIVAAAAKTEGTVDLDNIFYNLDANVSFNVKDAAKVNDKIVDVPSDDDHVLTINKDFIDSKTAHAITASYNFGEISCEQNPETGAWEIKNWVKTSNKSMNVTFACWESANSYAWVPAGDAAIKDANSNVIFAKKATQPQLQWSATGTNAIVKGEYIKTTNSYNTTYFGGYLNKVLGEKNFLKVKANSAHLYYGAQKDPYFTVSVDANGNATFTQSGVQVENAPVADHVETLKFVVLDAFHHERTISLDVKILRPAAAAKRK